VRAKIVVVSALILLLTVMLVLVSPLAPVSTTYAAASAKASPNPAILGSFVTVSGGGFLPNGIVLIIFLAGGGCPRLSLPDEVGNDGGGMGVLGFAPTGDPVIGGIVFTVTADNGGAFSNSILLDNQFSATNYSIIVFNGPNNFFCIDPFTIVLQLCVIQVGVEQPPSAVLWLPGYAYPDTTISQCENMTEVLGQDLLGGTIVIQQFVQNRTFYTAPMTTVGPIFLGPP